ncbi:MAG: HyaD/HybD family hydrogenase maturation endopeptidase [Bacteroidota bacterium]|nr:HyaD/HybD family hydrogenase maturation endopeptidase [Bacteroidota bacterium]
MSSPKQTLILGVGNVLLGDEGVGVHAVEHLKQFSLPPHVVLVDGGTGGFHLLSYFEEYSPIILIDATMDGNADGTVRLLRPKFASDFPKTLSAHDIGLRDLIETAALLSTTPPIFLITVSINDIQPMSMELSPAIQQALPNVATAVMNILKSENHTSTNGAFLKENQAQRLK